MYPEVRQVTSVHALLRGTRTQQVSRFGFCPHTDEVIRSCVVFLCEIIVLAKSS